MSDEINTNGNEESKEGLQQLLESTYPLLKEFRDKCPGTYKHSQTVASMVEGIALSLNLDVNKLKVAALYHDVGKMFCPKYFSENQTDDFNPHDKLDPKVSHAIITRHVSDTVIILINNHDFPRDVIEIISQHHGNGILRYFYNKSGTTEEDSFRYKTANPRTIQAAILMIADQIEARSKSEIQTGKFNASRLIEETINDLIDEGLLDDVTMRLGDLKKIKAVLAKELEGTYAKRVDYDDVISEEKVIKTKALTKVEETNE